MALAEDPFPQVQQEVRNTWNALTSRDAPPLTASERARRLADLTQDVADLEAAIAIARSDPERFRLSSEELAARARFVSDMQNALKGARQLSANNGRGTLLDGGGNETGGGRATRGGGGAAAADGGAANDAFVDGEVSTQATLLAEQDRDLDELASAVQRIGNLGRDMHIELEQQGELLEDLGGRFDGTISRLRKVRQRVDEVMEQTGRRNFCTILWLSVTFLVLTLLVVLT